MAEISPFQGIYYNEDKAGSASCLISPPYDVISPEEQDQLYSQSNHNFVRLVLGKESASDSDADNRFTRAGQLLQSWLSEGILIQDNSDGFYRQRIDYQVHGQQKSLYGITALVRLAEYQDRIILPHEKTLAGPKEGLHKLMDATQANLDSVWMMYEDNSGDIQNAVNSADWLTVINGAEDIQGVKYSLSKLNDASQMQNLVKLFDTQTLTIADGHHRYETALARSRQLDSERPAATVRPWNYVMATLVWTDDPGLTVLPTHRALSGLETQLLDSVEVSLNRSYNTRTVSISDAISELENLNESDFIWIYGDKGIVCTPASETDTLGAELSQQSVLAECLGFDITRLKSDKRIQYVEDERTAVEMLEGRDAQAAILLKAIPVRTITRYAGQLRAMPQKSTYFYPKLASGLVLRLIGEVAPVAR